jgi:hypothetical protein
MAQVTVELGRLLDKTNFKLFDFDYPFDDQTYKAKLEQNIIDFYYDYEIGFETPDMFKRKFKARWQRIIPYYNTLYNTTLLTYNPLSNQSLTEKLDQLAAVNNIQSTDMAYGSNGTNKVVGTNTTSGGNDITVDSKRSDYPQQPIAGSDYAAGETNETTHSTIDNTDSTDTTTTTTDSSTNRGSVTTEGTNNLDYTKTIEGITGITYPELIQKHREVLIRINDRIIEEMKSCFILVY